MLQKECPRWMAPINLIAGFVGLILALLTEFGVDMDFKGGVVVFVPLALIVVILSTVFCLFSTVQMLRKSMTWLSSIVRALCAVAVPGALSLMVWIAYKAPGSINGVSLTYTVLFIVALSAFWWYHAFPVVDLVAEAFVAVMICTNYGLVESMGAGSLWLHRIVCLLAMVAMIWGACRLVPESPMLGLAGLVAPLVSGIIWMVFEGGNEVASSAWMIIPIGLVMLASFYVLARIYGFWDTLRGGGSSSGGVSIPGKKGDIPDPQGLKVWRYVDKDLFQRDDWRWHVKITQKRSTITVTGTLWVDRETFLKEPEKFMSVSELRQYSIDIVKSGLKYYYSVYKGPDFRVRSSVTYKTVNL